MQHIDWHPQRWRDGTRGLTLEQAGAYIHLINECYLLGGPLMADDRWLAAVCNCSLRRVRVLISQLVALGKIAVLEDGRLLPNRCGIELERASARIAQRSGAATARHGRSGIARKSQDYLAETGGGFVQNQGDGGCGRNAGGHAAAGFAPLADVLSVSPRKSQDYLAETGGGFVSEQGDSGCDRMSARTAAAGFAPLPDVASVSQRKSQDYLAETGGGLLENQGDSGCGRSADAYADAGFAALADWQAACEAGSQDYLAETGGGFVQNQGDGGCDRTCGRSGDPENVSRGFADVSRKKPKDNFREIDAHAAIFNGLGHAAADNNNKDNNNTPLSPRIADGTRPRGPAPAGRGASRPAGPLDAVRGNSRAYGTNPRAQRPVVLVPPAPCPTGPPPVMAALEAVRGEVGDMVFRMWLAPLRIEPGPPPVLVAPTPFHRDFVRDRYLDRLRVALGGPVEVAVG